MKKIYLITISFLIINFAKSQDFSKQVNKNNQFSFDMLKYINVENENIFISPFSVSAALAMTYNGAKNKTRKEMSKVLYFSENSKELNESFKNIIKKTQTSKNTKKYTFNIANSLWAQKDFKFLHSYFLDIENYYGAPIEMVDYKSNLEREKTRLKINNWVEDKTNKKIKNLLDKAALDKDTKLVLVNAVYFLAEWQKSFNKKLTKPAVFYTLKDKTEKSFMKLSSRMKYYSNDNTEILEIPYKGSKASMIIFLPSKASQFNSLKQKLNNEFLKSTLKKLEYKNIVLNLPKFKIEYKEDLAGILKNAGMKRAFSNNADFSGMACKKKLKIDKVIHQTFINLDEAGTEAAAATAVIMKRVTSVGPNEKIIFNANKPFIFLIKDNSTGSVLFIGQLVK